MPTHRATRIFRVFSVFKIQTLLLAFVLSLGALHAPARAGELPQGFCYLDEVIPDAVYDVRYYGDYNFVGERIDGYLVERIVLTKQAAKALAKAQERLKPFGLTLKFFDGYRPQQAVDHFVRWARDLEDTRMKSEFYPNVPKNRLFKDGYIASRSGHSRGSTIDLTLADANGTSLDMGTGFDYFGPESWPENRDMSAQARANRALLRLIMTDAGFRPYSKEWWHFTLNGEPYPEKYYNFPIE